ncbi:RNA polymerase sigma factor [Phenylobacterium soli]|uniref:RNA polymerase sigma factor n=1 Tax=Phenylobacterium soli TaxID=2170551 RepID=UPI001D056A82|nr:RNA polymerase sigma factor [Phenylobacterium soli]
MAAPPPAPNSPDADEDPLVQAYLALRPNLIRFFAARAGSQAAAEDLIQELYVKLATRAEAIEAENPQALLYRIALNLMRDRARGEARAAARDAEWRGATRTAVAGEDISEEAPADEAAASRQRLRQLIDAVAALPPQMQKAFTLHKLEGLSHAQTAQAMGLSVKSVEKHISAALKHLAAKLSR